MNNKKHTEEAKNKMRKNAHIMKGSEHPLFKGDKVGYRGLHYWIGRELGKPMLCELCRVTNLKPRQFHWANRSGRYERTLTDWIRLCAKCHFKFDNKVIPSRWK